MTDLATLTHAEQVSLDDCESRIERGLKTFVEVGQALAAIRENRLYRAEHSTFELYCRERWGFNRHRASQLIAAVDVVTNVTSAGLTAPANEGQARELAKVPEPERAEVWRETVERTEGKPTAAAIRETASRTQTPGPSGAAIATPPVGPGTTSRPDEEEATPASATTEDPPVADKSPAVFADRGAGAQAAVAAALDNGSGPTHPGNPRPAPPPPRPKPSHAGHLPIGVEMRACDLSPTCLHAVPSAPKPPEFQVGTADYVVNLSLYRRAR